MRDGIEGGCRCGAVRYRLNLDRLPKVYACHCRDCQTWSGSAFSLQCVMPEEVLAVTGSPYLYERVSDDGARVSHQRGCPICLTRVYNTNTHRPGAAWLRAGTLDRSDELEIAVHIWTKRKLSGIDIPAAVPSWPENAPLADFLALLSP